MRHGITQTPTLDPMAAAGAARLSCERRCVWSYPQNMSFGLSSGDIAMISNKRWKTIRKHSVTGAVHTHIYYVLADEHLSTSELEERSVVLAEVDDPYGKRSMKWVARAEERVDVGLRRYAGTIVSE